MWDYPVRGEASYGLQPVFVNLSEEQVKQGYEVHVIARKEDGKPEEEVCGEVQIHRVSVPFNLTAMRMVRRIVGDDRDWVVHTHATCGLFMIPLRQIQRLNLVCHSHGTSRSHHLPMRLKSGNLVVDYSRIGITYDMIREKYLWRSADKVLAVSQTLMRDMRDSYGISQDRLSVVYNGADTGLFRPGAQEIPAPLKELSNKKIVLYVGHFGLRKGIFFLIRAMRVLRSRVPDCHLVCIGGVPSWLGGDDYWGLLRQEIELNGVKESVTLMDKVKNSDLPAYYRAAKVFALPSYYETISKVTLEAMASGLPVVATNTGGIPEVVDDGKTGILVPYGSVSGLATALETILSDEELSRKMGGSGRTKVENQFTWGAVAERVKAAYGELG